MRPKPSDKQRERWRKYPLTAVGLLPNKQDMARIKQCLEEGDVAGAQRITLDFLALAIDGPSFRVHMGPDCRRKQLVVK